MVLSLVMSICMVVFVNSLMEKPQEQIPSLPKFTSMAVTCCYKPLLPYDRQKRSVPYHYNLTIQALCERRHHGQRDACL